MKRWIARNIMGVWLALGVFSLASCAPIYLQPGAKSSNPSTVGSASAPATEPQAHFAADALIDNTQSQALTSYLHTHQLPLVGARVLASNGGSRQVILYGYVATPFGKADAADRAREYLNDSGAQVDNRLKIEPDLAGNPSANPPNASASQPDNSEASNPDIQRYEEQQQQTAQQQQYMSQGRMGGLGGSPGLMMILPFLLGGSFGGGGSSFGFSTGPSPYGSAFGSPYASPYGSPYGSPYSGYPAPGFGSSGGNPFGP